MTTLTDWLDRTEAEHAEDHPYCTGCPLTRAMSTVRAAADLHQPVDRTAVSCDDEDCEHATCTRITVTICAACDEMCATAYFYYAESSLEVVEWPCPTIRVIATALAVTP